jgi:restriction system protein
MAIPTYEAIMLPLLALLNSHTELSLRESIERLAIQFELNDVEKQQLLPSGQQTIFSNRVGWARTYLKKAALVETPKRGQIKITQRGKEVIAKKPEFIDDAFLKQFSEFVEFKNFRKYKPDKIDDDTKNINKTPQEHLETAYRELIQALASDILQAIKTCSPSFFENLVIEVLVKMGYGGSRDDAKEVIGRPGDEGIDGIIKEDRLGLDMIYIQAKRWEGTVGRPEIQKFAGALQGHRAKKGIFITTSNFTKEARDYVSRIDSKIVLIDGETLAQLMIENNVGVNLVISYEIKRIDFDYFSDEV